MKLTVILRNDSPMIHCGDSPSYRSVQVDLTPDQCAAIAPRKTESSGGTDEYVAWFCLGLICGATAMAVCEWMSR